MSWEVEAARIAIYIITPIVIFGGWWMWSAERVCRKKNKVLYIREDGDTDTEYVNKEGGQVRITNPVTGVTRLWPVNQLSTIGQPYPDLGILPKFLTREIRTVIVVEGDLEPLLNRSPHRNNVVSPNVVNQLLDIIEDETCPVSIATVLQELVDRAVTGPTRELVARPEWAGALERSSTLKALASVGDTLLERLERIEKQLIRFAGLNSTYIYIGLAINAILSGVVLYFLIQAQQGGTGTEAEMLKKIMGALGIAR